MNVERVEVLRAVVQRLADGTPVLVFEGIHFNAECGCRMTFGVRADNEEKTCGYYPCERHAPQGSEILSEFAGANAPKIDTELWLGQLLARST